MTAITNPNDNLLKRLDQFDVRLEDFLTIIKEKSLTLAAHQSPFLTTRQAADYLGISPKTIYNNPERFNPVRLKNGGLRFRKTDLERLVT